MHRLGRFKSNAHEDGEGRQQPKTLLIIPQLTHPFKERATLQGIQLS